jgi:hypothetical protein
MFGQAEKSTGKNLATWGWGNRTKGLYDTWQEKYEKEGLPGGADWVIPQWQPAHGRQNYRPIPGMEFGLK